MFNWFKKDKPQAQKPMTMRDLLFGDLPFSEWPRDNTLNAEPWASFVRAREHVNARQIDPAVAELKMLTPSGLHFGYGGFKTLYEDPKGHALIHPATQLMQRLTKLGRSH